LQLFAEGLAPFLVEDRPERAEVGAQPTGGDPCLVHALGILPEAHARIVGDEAQRPVRDRGLCDLGGRRGEVALRGLRDVGWVVTRYSLDVPRLTRERGTVERDRQLHRPTLGVAVAEAGPRAGEPKVVGVEVDRLESNRLGGLCVQTWEGVEVRNVEQWPRR